MFLDKIKILCRGDQNGNRWIIQIGLPSGIEIFGLATENRYGGDWDLGPTWNFVVRTENPFLVDTGRYGMGGPLLEMVAQAGLSQQDLKGVLLSHGHEDHDGGLGEIVQRTSIPAWVHPIYQHLSRSYVAQAPEQSKRSFPACCWHCFMPESFTGVECAGYHRERIGLHSHLLEGPTLPFDSSIRIHHLPGHSPDGLAYQIGREALIVGDSLLPEITPHPTQEALYRLTGNILPTQFKQPEKIYGLRAYLRSLKKLRALGREFPEMIALPAHRLFYENRWQMFELEKRSVEIIEHHIQRCASILDILKDRPRKVGEIVKTHFDPGLLKGAGFKMAEAEIKSHLELLEHSGDVEWEREGEIRATGANRFEQYITDISLD